MAKKPRKNSKYKKTYPDIAAKLYREGATDIQVAKHFGVHKSTLNVWKNKYPEFGEVLQEARYQHDTKFVVSALLKRAKGYNYTETRTETNNNGIVTKVIKTQKHVPPDVGALSIWLFNRSKGHWQNVKHIQHSGEGGGPLIIKIVKFSKENGSNNSTK